MRFTNADLTRLARQARREGNSANAALIRRTILDACYLIVYSRARRHAFNPIDEIVNVGLAAIADKLDRFDSAKGAFCSWAAFTADRAMAAYIAEGFAAIRVPYATLKEHWKQGKAPAVEIEGLESVASLKSESTNALEALIEAEQLARLTELRSSHLSNAERQVIKLSFGLGSEQEAMTVPQIARAMRLSISTVKQLRASALATLRERLSSD